MKILSRAELISYSELIDMKSDNKLQTRVFPVGKILDPKHNFIKSAAFPLQGDRLPPLMLGKHIN